MNTERFDDGIGNAQAGSPKAMDETGEQLNCGKEADGCETADVSGAVDFVTTAVKRAGRRSRLANRRQIRISQAGSLMIWIQCVKPPAMLIKNITHAAAKIRAIYKSITITTMRLIRVQNRQRLRTNAVFHLGRS